MTCRVGSWYVFLFLGLGFQGLARQECQECHGQALGLPLVSQKNPRASCAKTGWRHAALLGAKCGHCSVQEIEFHHFEDPGLDCVIHVTDSTSRDPNTRCVFHEAYRRGVPGPPWPRAVPTADRTAQSRRAGPCRRGGAHGDREAVGP